LVGESNLKFDHVGVVVGTMDAGRDHLSLLFGITLWSEEFSDQGIGVHVQFGLDPSGICYELVSPLREDSPVTRALKARDRILNHVAYLVPDLDAEAARIRRLRCLPAGPAMPAVAYGGKRVQFFITPLYFIIELIEAPDHTHTYFNITG
jgi:methylmalonyl-CoA/ethylmalonyl-CoA epimerase